MKTNTSEMRFPQKARVALPETTPSEPILTILERSPCPGSLAESQNCPLSNPWSTHSSLDPSKQLSGAPEPRGLRLRSREAPSGAASGAASGAKSFHRKLQAA